MLGRRAADRAVGAEVEDVADLDGRPMRSSWAASMSDTMRNWFWADPGAALVRLVPNWTEQLDPGGVNWSIPEPGGVRSCRQPRLR